MVTRLVFSLLVALCAIFSHLGETTTEETSADQEEDVSNWSGQAEEEESVTEKRYAYLKGDREPDDKKYESPDDMYRYALKHVLQLFWSEKCHISEVKFQHGKLGTPLDKRIAEAFDKANELMGDCADDILSTLQDNITSSERVEPIDQKTFDHIASIFKNVRHYFDEEMRSAATTKEMNIIREEMRLADEQLHEGYEIVKEMIKNTTLPWPS